MKELKLLFIIAFLSCVTNVYAQICSDNICEIGESIENCPRDCWLDTFQVFLNEGGRVDWDKSGSNLIAFDMKDATGYYDVYTINPDGTGISCITCGVAGLPQNNNGNPAWSPNGEWIVFQSENVHLDSTITSNNSTPGLGAYSNLWVYHTLTNNFTQLTFLADSIQFGVIHPHFSHDGSKLSWSEKYGEGGAVPFGQFFGVWKLKTADFSVSNGLPTLTNENTYQPYDEVFYENHGFTDNDSSLLFTSNEFLWVIPYGNNNIHLLNLFTNTTTQITDSTYNEHAQFTPNGEKIVWGTSRMNANNGMDYWVMNPDGTNKQRLTYFNDSAYPEYIMNGYAVDMSFSATGDQMVGYVQTNVITQEGKIYLFNFNNPMVAVHPIAREIDKNIIYPNPATGSITIRFPDIKKSIRASIHDLSGNLVLQKVYQNQLAIQLELNGANGVYFLKVITDDELFKTYKVLKQ